jgi:electron transfer flavoprotein alpha subunit
VPPSAPNDWQVGQTGKVIVAVIKDEEAPIFQMADLFLALPELEPSI